MTGLHKFAKVVLGHRNWRILFLAIGADAALEAANDGVRIRRPTDLLLQAAFISSKCALLKVGPARGETWLPYG